MRVVVLLWLATLSAVASGQTLVILEGGAVAQICASCSPRQARFPVSPTAGFKVKKTDNSFEQPAVFDASFLAVHVATPPKLFQARWELTRDGIPVAIVVEVDQQVNRPGTYDLLLGLQPRSNPQGSRLKLQITQSAAKLEVPDKVVVRRSVWFPFLLPPARVDQMELNIRETTGLADLVPVQVFSRPSSSGGQPVSGQLQIVGAEPPICGTNKASATSWQGWFSLPAGCQTKLKYDLAGEFPLGDVTGSVQMIAPELSDPVSVNYEVKSGLVWLYVPAAIFIGLLISYLIKVKLQTTIELNEARAKAGDILSRVQADLNRYKDQAFHNELRDPTKDLKDAYHGDNAQAITDATTALDSKWRDALQHVATLRQDAQQILDDVGTVTQTPWTIPSRVREVIEQASQEIDKARELLDVNDASTARSAARAAQMQLGAGLRSTSLEWQNYMHLLLRTLEDAHAGIPAPVIAQFKDELQHNPPDLAKVKGDSPISPATALLAILQDLSSEYVAGGTLLAGFAERLRQEWSEFEKQLAPVTVPHPEALEPIRKLIDASSTIVQSTLNDSQGKLNHLQDHLDKLQVAWRDALVKQVASPAKDLEDAIKAQDFVRAAELVTSSLKAASGGTFLKAGSSAPATTVIAWPKAQPPAAQSQVTVLASQPQILTMPADLDLGVLTPIEQVRRAKKLQSILIGVVLFIWALGAYGQNWQGTWAELSTVFFGALGLDITLDALQSRLKPR